MNNPINFLLGRTFSAPSYGNIGNFIEAMLGTDKMNNSSKADFGFWELKTHRVDAKSRMTLGGKKGCDINGLLEQVYNKIQNVILVEYRLNNDNTFTIIEIVFLFSLSKKNFFSGLQNTYKIENHHDTNNVKIYRNGFISLYQKNKIVYRA